MECKSFRGLCIKKGVKTEGRNTHCKAYKATSIKIYTNMANAEMKRLLLFGMNHGKEIFE